MHTQPMLFMKGWHNSVAPNV